MIEIADDWRDVGVPIAESSRARGLWPRRASCVAFVRAARAGERRYPGLLRVVFGAAERVVADRARFAQTAVGWLLRELSASHPGDVRAFLSRHESAMSLEARRNAAKGLARGARR